MFSPGVDGHAFLRADAHAFLAVDAHALILLVICTSFSAIKLMVPFGLVEDVAVAVAPGPHVGVLGVDAGVGVVALKACPAFSPYSLR